MNYRALTLGAAIGFLVALSPSCGPSTPDCGPSNCNGCCNADGACVDTGEQSTAACGTQGNACGACAATESCNGGTCTPVNTVTDNNMGNACGNRCQLPNGQCASIPCTDGCCDANGVCKLGTDDNQCGRGSQTAAVACTSCSATGETCDVTASSPTYKSCVGASAIGDSCTQDSECSALGTGAICKRQTTGLADGGEIFPYPNGYCTLDCAVDPDVCPTDSTCMPHGQFTVSIYGETQAICMRRCDLTGVQTYQQLWARCDPGFTCVNLGDPIGSVCALSPPMPEEITGTACTDDNQCGTAVPPWRSLCIAETFELNDGGTAPSGFTGGYCTAVCNRTAVANDPNSECEGEDLCIQDGSDRQLGICYTGCGADGGFGQPGQCRSNYTCTQVLRSPTDETLVGGACQPTCEESFCNTAYQAGGQSVWLTCTDRGFCCLPFWVTPEGDIPQNFPDGGLLPTYDDAGTLFVTVDLTDGGTTDLQVTDAGENCDDVAFSER